MTTITANPTLTAPAEDPADVHCGSIASLHTTFTADEPDGRVAILTEQRALILTDSPRGLGSLAPGDLLDAERDLLNDELAAYVSQHRRGPVVLERMLDRGEGILIHFEVRVMPLAASGYAEFEDLLTDPDEDVALEIAHAYLADLETAWSTRHEGRSLPVCFIEELGRCSAPALLA